MCRSWSRIHNAKLDILLWISGLEMLKEMMIACVSIRCFSRLKRDVNGIYGRHISVMGTRSDSAGNVRLIGVGRFI